jgi:hypothetical protein
MQGGAFLGTSSSSAVCFFFLRGRRDSGTSVLLGNVFASHRLSVAGRLAFLWDEWRRRNNPSRGFGEQHREADRPRTQNWGSPHPD